MIRYLGTVMTEPDETVTFNIRANADPTAIAAAITQANLERAEAQARESARLRELFPIEDERHD